jgi:hypothetical protein
MLNKSFYFIPSNNLPKIVEFRYLNAEQDLLTREQLEKQQRVEESYYEEFATSYGDLRVTKGYGPCVHYNCKCRCSSSECICDNYTRYRGTTGGTLLKLREKESKENNSRKNSKNRQEKS